MCVLKNNVSHENAEGGGDSVVLGILLFLRHSRRKHSLLFHSAPLTLSIVNCRTVSLCKKEEKKKKFLCTPKQEQNKNKKYKETRAICAIGDTLVNDCI